MNKPEKFTMTDGSPYNGMLRRGHSVFKAKSHKGTQKSRQRWILLTGELVSILMLVGRTLLN